MKEQTPERTSFLNKAKKFLSTPAGIALTLLCAAVFITGIVYLITTTKILYVGRNILHAPTMLLLNILPVLLALLLFFFLTRKIGFSCSLVGIVLIFFAVVDRVKVSMRQEPLLPTDLTLAKEVIAILKTFRGTSGMQLSEIEGCCTAASAADSGSCACACLRLWGKSPLVCESNAV